MKCLLCKNHAFKHSIQTFLLPPDPEQHYIIENQVKALEIWWLPSLYSLQHGCILQTVMPNLYLNKKHVQLHISLVYSQYIALTSGDRTYIQLLERIQWRATKFVLNNNSLSFRHEAIMLQNWSWAYWFWAVLQKSPMRKCPKLCH